MVQAGRTQIATVTVAVAPQITPLTRVFYCSHGFCTLCNPFFNAFDYPVCFYLHVFITVKDAEHVSAVAEPVVVPDES